MRWTQETVVARTDGHRAAAQVAECTDCGSRRFVVYLLGPRALPHYQCCACDTTFCDGHSCSEEETRMADRTTAFTYHRPSPEVQAIMTRIRESYQALGNVMDGSIPESREKSLAWTALEESAMWAMKALSVTDAGGVVVDPPPAEARERAEH